MLKTPNIEKFLEYDDKRTRGLWRWFFHTDEDINSGGVEVCDIEGDYHNIVDIVESKRDVMFIAQATKIANEIRALKKENEKLESVVDGFQIYNDLITRLLPYIETAVNDPSYKQEGIKKLLQEIREVCDDK